MICMTVMICYDHRNFSTFWVILFSQTFQHHFKNAWVNLDVSFPASKEWTRWTDAVGKLWPGSSGKSAFVQSVFFRLSKWKNVATCPLYPIQVPGKMWRYTHYCPLYIYISLWLRILLYILLPVNSLVLGGSLRMSRFVQSRRGARFHSRPPGAWAGEERFLGPTKRRTTGATLSFWRFQLPTVWHIFPRKRNT